MWLSSGGRQQSCQSSSPEASVRGCTPSLGQGRSGMCQDGSISAPSQCRRRSLRREFGDLRPALQSLLVDVAMANPLQSNEVPSPSRRRVLPLGAISLSLGGSTQRRDHHHQVMVKPPTKMATTRPTPVKDPLSAGHVNTRASMQHGSQDTAAKILSCSLGTGIFTTVDGMISSLRRQLRTMPSLGDFVKINNRKKESDVELPTGTDVPHATWRMLPLSLSFTNGVAVRRGLHQRNRVFANLQGSLEVMGHDNRGLWAHAAVKGANLRKYLARLARLEQPPADVWLSATNDLYIGDTLQVQVTVRPPRNLFDKLWIDTWAHLRKKNLVRVQYEKTDVPVYAMNPDSSRWRAFIPTTPLDSPGSKDLVVEVSDGRHRPFQCSVELKNRDYVVESIWLSDSKAGLLGTKHETKAVASLRQRKTPEQYWEGKFVVPSDGEVTTPYGVQRYYNGVFAKGYYHRGVDYGAPEGDIVKAPAGGEVALVGREEEGFVLHGNCVGLDHGQGVTSILMHLSDIKVAEGQRVRAGDVVGTIGETGLATGPHLHWGLYVGSKCVDPEPWIGGQIK